MNEKALPLLLLLGAAFLTLGAGRKRSPRFIEPVKGSIRSKFGTRINPIDGKSEFHNGIDIAVPEGTPIKSPANGTIVSISQNDIGGKQVVILHKNGFKTGYAHLSRIILEKGEIVDQGEIFAFSGKTGRVTGAHLHFTLRDPEGKLVDPGKLIYQST
jgi:murein DD-endopeptidase MepM/ murein hydrolase activator NlpD